ncbi:hypothetical protein NJT12_00190 [Flavobacterium sp. AC]|uniref:Uncharacterized protein n=1 Tax=Flavobacterium azizsancarii TaxID=2961580 RepID=A0ABT4W658_9FLAO|nr:hypothetical protein [Flavobacterium azizsancarii]MDA6068021.1 hypothetical protein [Flavobacterium azizsancarii]
MTATKPQVYTGTGSAIDNYNDPKKQLQNIVNGTKEVNWGLFDMKNSKHRRIQSDLRQANIVVKNNRHGEVADMLGWFNRFLKSDKSPVKKPLKQMTSKELSKIIKALDGVVIWKHSI